MSGGGLNADSPVRGHMERWGGFVSDLAAHTQAGVSVAKGRSVARAAALIG